MPSSSMDVTPELLPDTDINGDKKNNTDVVESSSSLAADATQATNFIGIESSASNKLSSNDNDDDVYDDNSDTDADADADSDDDTNTSELIRLASAAAIRNAVQMKRSDSDLSQSTDDNDDSNYNNNDDDDDDILEELLEEDRKQHGTTYGGVARACSPQLLNKNANTSSKYMEQASYEACLVEYDDDDDDDNDNNTDIIGSRRRTTQLKPSGRMGRVAHRRSSLGIINVVLDGGSSSDDGEGYECENENDSNEERSSKNNDSSHCDKSQRRRASEFESFHCLKSMRGVVNVLKENNDDGDNDDGDADADADVDNNNNDDTTNNNNCNDDGETDKKQTKILLEQPKQARKGQSQPKKFELSEVLVECGMNIEKLFASNTDNNSNSNINSNSKEEKEQQHDDDVHVVYLHALFDGFCRPPLEIDSVRQIVELERRRCRRRSRQEQAQTQSQTPNEDDKSDGNGLPLHKDEEEDTCVQLPVGVVVQRPSGVLLKVLTGSSILSTPTPTSTSTAPFYLKRLPPVFASSLFRILLRLLEGYTDARYDSCVVLASCPWQCEAKSSLSSLLSSRKRTRTQTRTQTQTRNENGTPQSPSTTTATTTTTKSTTTPPGSSRDNEKLFVGTTNDAATNATLMYSIVRLRMQWGHSIQSLIAALTSLLSDPRNHNTQQQQQQQQIHHQYYYYEHDHYLLSPMIRLLGLLCAGGVSVKDLRQMISFASATASNTAATTATITSKLSLPMTMQLLMVRALAVAASTAASSCSSHRLSSSSSSSSSSSYSHSTPTTLVLMGKANLKNFFSFVSGPGIRRTIHLDDPQQQATWPFRNDFGTAFSFRAEDFFSSAPPNQGQAHGQEHGENHNGSDSHGHSDCGWDGSCILLQALSETGSGIEISLVPLVSQQQQGQAQTQTNHQGTHTTTTANNNIHNNSNISNIHNARSTAAVISIKTVENHKVVDCIKVNNCPLHARVWYHVAIRHTRSRLKGVFSLSSREQLTVLLDGKPMLTEAMKFPQIRNDSSSSKKSLSFTVGKNFDGQIGSIYVFRDNVSDATFKAMYETTETTSSTTTTTTSIGKTVDSHSIQNNQSPRTSAATTISRNIRSDDLEHIAFSSSNKDEDNGITDTADICEDEEKSEPNHPLSKSSFISRLYVSWNPRRQENNFLMELHSGAHLSLDPQCVQAVCIESAQQIIGSIGGVQILLSIFQSVLGEKSLQRTTTNKKRASSADEIANYSLVPDLLNLLSCFIRGHHQNARELLRCGGIDVVERLLLENKTKSGNGAAASYKKYSIVRALFILPTLSRLLVQTLVELQSSCKHFAALETKVFSALLFNIPLWLEGQDREVCVSLYPAFLPTLSNIVLKNPAKVRNLVGATDVIWLLRDIVEIKVSGLYFTNRIFFVLAARHYPIVTHFINYC